MKRMNKNIAVIYQSHYCATKKYAEWIASALGAELLERKKASAATLQEYDVIVYGGGLYASSILGADFVSKNPCKNLVLFTVGLSDPTTTDYGGVIKKSFSAGDPPKVFHLRGALDYKRLKLVHRGLIAALKKVVEKKPAAERSSVECEILRAYGGTVDYIDKGTIAPLVEYVRRLVEKQEGFEI
jgi:menaquinone-dependent protoporphyrinogen IX oxidase